MEKTTIYGLCYKGGMLPLAEDVAGEYDPTAVKSWELTHKPYTGAAAIKVGIRLAEKKIGPQFGTDAATTERARGAAIMAEVVTDWPLQTEDGALLPISEDNIGLLPPMVLAAFGNRLEYGIYPTKEELEALRTGPLAKKSGSSKTPD